MRCLLAIVISISFALTGQVLMAIELPQLEVQPHWKELYRTPPEYVCASHGLFVFLRLAGFSFSFSEVHSALGPSPEGTSLRRIRDAAQRLGVPVRIVRGSYDALVATQKPILLYVLSGKSPSRTASFDLGHYIVVFDMASDNVRFIDGELAMNGTYSRESLVEMWSGHCLVLDDSPKWQLLLRGSLVGAVFLLCVVIFLQSKLGWSSGSVGLARSRESFIPF